MSITTTDLPLDLLTIQKRNFDGFVGAAESNRKQCFSRTFVVKIAVSVCRPLRKRGFHPGLPDCRTYTAVVFYSHRQPKTSERKMPQSTAGAGNGIRTRMVSPPADFKSAASTDLTIPAYYLIEWGMGDAPIQ